MEILDPGDEYILNLCTKCLSRVAVAPGVPADGAAPIAEAWRFPIIDGVRRTRSDPQDDDRDLVTFVYKLAPADAQSIQVLGTFATLLEPIPLKPVRVNGEDTGYRSLSVVLPKAQVYSYKYLLDGGLRRRSYQPAKGAACQRADVVALLHRRLPAADHP